ncbi:MAG: CHRD domain-containing protein, partial [Dehalococcoidia bacterium]
VLTADNLVGAGDCATSFDAFVDALITGKAYVNVHTIANPGGVVRGQVGLGGPAAAVELAAGWNFAPWKATQCSSAEDAFRQLVEEGILNVAWTFDAPIQVFDRSYAPPPTPPVLNTLAEVCPADEVVIINVSAPTIWIQGQ